MQKLVKPAFGVRSARSSAMLMMASSIVIGAAKSWVSHKTAQNILVYTHYSSPIILLAFFLLAFTAYSIVTASSDAVIHPSPDQTGPGGKPLPQKFAPSAKEKLEKNASDFSRGRRLLFEWLSVGTILTFVGNAVVVILHALLDREDNWWCGESVAVRLYRNNVLGQTILT